VPLYGKTSFFRPALKTVSPGLLMIQDSLRIHFSNLICVCCQEFANCPAQRQKPSQDALCEGFSALLD
jgi:hypothetical protein